MTKTRAGHRIKPEVIDLEHPFHRRMVYRAYTALLTHGGDEPDHHPECMGDEAKAKAKAGGYALRHWDDLL